VTNHADAFELGRPLALWRAAQRAELIALAVPTTLALLMPSAMRLGVIA
jgi:hypothetical protein